MVLANVVVVVVWLPVRVPVVSGEQGEVVSRVERMRAAGEARVVGA